MLLADAGASVLRVDRPATTTTSSSTSSTGSRSPLPTGDLLTRHKTSITVDLKNPHGIALLHALIPHIDVLIDPFRPSVLERLSLGPSHLLSLNPRLIYARLTGFRRDGRFAAMAGHDINYLAVSGVLSLLGRTRAPPTPPQNLLADFAGGGATLVQGILLALVSRVSTGKGQVVEASMVDGAGYLASFSRFMVAGRVPGLGDRPRGENLLDSGCPYYDVYETRDRGRFVAVGALEPQFFAALLKGLGLQGMGWEEKRYDRDRWPELRRVFEDVFRTRTRDEWEQVFAGSDACCTPVYEYAEMRADPVAKEGDQRPPVTLRDTPCLAVKKGVSDDASHGQGPGVEGEGYIGYPLAPGEGGVETLKAWLNWTRGVHFDVRDGGLVLKDKARL
jgi:alpha-methylacyl-CoA racemase